MFLNKCFKQKKLLKTIITKHIERNRIEQSAEQSWSNYQATRAKTPHTSSKAESYRVAALRRDVASRCCLETLLWEDPQSRTKKYTNKMENNKTKNKNENKTPKLKSKMRMNSIFCADSEFRNPSLRKKHFFRLLLFFLYFCPGFGSSQVAGTETMGNESNPSTLPDGTCPHCAYRTSHRHIPSTHPVDASRWRARLPHPVDIPACTIRLPYPPEEAAERGLQLTMVFVPINFASKQKN